MERWTPMPVPLGDGRHDIGDDARAAIVRRLTEDFERDPDLTPEKARQLAQWAAASVRALLHELGTLRDMDAADPRPVQPTDGLPEPEPVDECELARTFRPLTKPSIAAWELCWPLDEDQRRAMASMLASYAAMLVVHQSHLFAADPRPVSPSPERTKP